MSQNRPVRRRARRIRHRSPAEVLGPMLAVAQRRGTRPLIKALEALLARWEARR